MHEYFMNNLECRKQKMTKEFYCKKYKKNISLQECSSCQFKIYKNNKNYRIKKSSKLIKLEKERFSIFTEDLSHCIMCGKNKDALHEVIFGSNRLNSIKYGIVIPLCTKHHLECHKNSKLQHIWKIKAQEVFEKTYPHLNFVKIFGKNYK